MSQQQAFEAARVRIQRLVEEIAALSKKEMRSEEFFQQFLARAVQACDARGGAVWLVQQRQADGKGEFQLVAQVEFESSLFQSDEAQRAAILKHLTAVVQSKAPAVFPAPPAPPAPGSLDAQLSAPPAPAEDRNRTAYPFVHIPLALKDQVVGVLQVWLQAYVTAENFAEFATFLGSLAQHVEQHLQSRRLGTMMVENQRLQHVLKFTNDIAGSLDPVEVSRLAASYGRDLLGVDRCAVLVCDQGEWRVLAISGQEVVEKKSSMVKAMVAFVSAHAKSEMVSLSKKELLARHAQPVEAEMVGTSGEPPALPRTDAIDLAYFEHSHIASGAVAPMLNEEKRIIGALFAESTAEEHFSPRETTSTHRLAEWLATHTQRSLAAARDYDSLPFIGVAKRIRGVKHKLTGTDRRRHVFRWIVGTAIALVICLFPKMDRVDGDCSLVPTKRSGIVPEIPGRIERVAVREGQRVKKGDVIAQLETRRIETELAVAEKEQRRLEAEAQRYRSLNDEGASQVALIQAQAAAKSVEKFRADVEAATLKSPIEGIVLQKDLELKVGEYLQAGSLLTEIAATDAWNLDIDVDEKEIGRVEAKLAGGAVPVSYHLYSQNAEKLFATLERRDQISTAAFPREASGSHVFMITLHGVDIPAGLREAMRSGLTGRAHVELGKKPLIVIYARRVWNWFRLRMIG